MPPTTRPAAPADAELVHRLTQTAFATLIDVIDPPSSAHRETVADVSAALDAGTAAIAELDGVAVGAARFRAASDHLYVGRVAVVPEGRGKGVARALVDAAEREAAARGLPELRVEVRAMLPGNVAMFRRLGFEVVSADPHPREPAVTVLTLAKPVAVTVETAAGG